MYAYNVLNAYFLRRDLVGVTSYKIGYVKYAATEHGRSTDEVSFYGILSCYS